MKRRSFLGALAGFVLAPFAMEAVSERPCFVVFANATQCDDVGLGWMLAHGWTVVEGPFVDKEGTRRYLLKREGMVSA